MPTSAFARSGTQYNVLKVARRSFLTSADPAKADFYERAINNGIIGNQNKLDRDGATSYIYMQPLGGVNLKPWGKSDYGFPCCWGTLSESFAKLGDSIFFWSSADKALYVNQFVSATAKLRQLPGEVSVRQVAGFPIDPSSTSTLTVEGAGGDFDIMLRVPEWCEQPASSLKHTAAVAPTMCARLDCAGSRQLHCAGPGLAPTRSPSTARPWTAPATHRARTCRSRRQVAAGRVVRRCTSRTRCRSGRRHSTTIILSTTVSCMALPCRAISREGGCGWGGMGGAGGAGRWGLSLTQLAVVQLTR
eukprot:SAG11_NODE_1194_length_5548_cov_3.456414_7_plen_304_part_00